MNTYYLRTTDYPTLLTLGAALGVINLTYAEYEDQEQTVDGFTTIIKVPVGAPIPVATGGGHFDYIGQIQKPTGATEVNEFGTEVAVTAPIADELGTAYIHVNLITPHDIRVLAEASEIPEVVAALAQINSFFVTGSEGNATAPANPHRIFR